MPTTPRDVTRVYSNPSSVNVNCCLIDFALTELAFCHRSLIRGILDVMRKWVWIAFVLVALAVLVAIIFVVKMGPANVIGMLRYDQREEGTLRVGDRAPDVLLLAP